MRAGSVIRRPGRRCCAAAREALYQRHLAEYHAKGRAINMAATLEVDAVIDPAETRRRLVQGLVSSRIGAPTPGGIDPW